MDHAYLFNNGQDYMSYLYLGSRPEVDENGLQGYRFRVWAPNASAVCIVGDFNNWNLEQNNMIPVGSTGIWSGFIADVQQWERYKYAILTQENRWIYKADPYARHSETRPGTASKLYDPDDYVWQDDEFMKSRRRFQQANPLSIYEVHLGSWRRYPDGSVYNYRDIAPQLSDYVKEMGYTAIELMPLMEHPFDGSWGYQVTGYYSVTSRYGTPADLKYFVDHMHQNGIRVFLDWVPGHFPKDDFGLAQFDGTPIFEYPDPLMGEHDTWGTLVFNYEKSEVRSFLLSNAFDWLKEFHFDGLRVDAVSSMLYRNYCRQEYIPNINGGLENYEAISLLQEINSLIHQEFPGVVMMAEESTPFPMVTSPVEKGGLGFDYKWNMGWMNDTLFYNSVDHYLRGKFQDKFTFSMMYAFSEKYILPFSHDEVVHGKGTLLDRMPGDYWRKFANLRNMFAYQFAHPGAKLNFMGNEFAPFLEWRFYEELEWFMLNYPAHGQMRDFVKELNHLYVETNALWENDENWDGFRWIQVDDRENSVFAFLRFNKKQDEAILCVLNETPGVLPQYSLDLPISGELELILNSDDGRFGGSDYLHGFEKKSLYKLEKIKTKISAAAKKQTAGKQAADHSEQHHKYKLNLTIPPLAALYFKWKKEEKKK